ncbi:MAG: sulfur carrier protein ThiS adenylyltransferase ThiF [Candidatus Omnitrophica bacterium]|nr:sulfur carrier protein ThiS adenylyltransferase ThiF [Candidatus Omnitrophota bacterium]
MNMFEQKLREQLSTENFAKIQKVKIGIAGLGGLGSNCAMNLVRSGFKNFKLIDFDKVDYSNLNRQFYFYEQVEMLKTEALSINLKMINPAVQLQALTIKIEQENVNQLFADCDIVVEALDKAEAKSLLTANLLPTLKLIIAASGIAGIGDSDLISIHWLKKNLVIVGDLSSDVQQSFPFSPKVNIAAAKQADIILKYTISDFLNNELCLEL